MVLGSRARSRGIRSVAGAALVSMLVGPLRIAYGAPVPASKKSPT
jgi:hypothetical protein